MPKSEEKVTQKEKENAEEVQEKVLAEHPDLNDKEGAVNDPDNP